MANTGRVTLNWNDPEIARLGQFMMPYQGKDYKSSPYLFDPNQDFGSASDAIARGQLTPQMFVDYINSGKVAGVSGFQNAAVNPDGSISYDGYRDNSTDWGGLLATAAFGGALFAPAIAAAGAGSAGAGVGLEAGALTGAPGYGAALESSLAGAGAATGAGAGSLTNSGATEFGTGLWEGAAEAGQIPTLVEGGAAGAATGSSLPNIPTPPTGGGGNSGATEFGTGSWTGGEAGAIPTSVGGGAAGAALGGAAQAGTALSRILSGAGTAADWASVLGTAGSTALGIYGADQQGDALRGIAEQARTDRQPFLNKSLEWLNNPQAYQDGPGKSSLDATLRALSVQGNPIGNPGSLAIAGDIANKGWQNAVTGFGNLGLAGQDSRSQLLSNAATADRGVTTALSSGLGSLTQPDSSLDALLKQLRGLGGSSQFGLV